MTLDKLIQECQRLREKAHGTESKYFEFLVKMDSEYRKLWIEAGFTRFSLFLTAKGLASEGEIKRFELYKRARADLGGATARELGVEATIKAHKASRPTPTRAPRRDYAALEAENRELRAALAAEQAKVRALTEENTKLKKQIEKLESRRKAA